MTSVRAYKEHLFKKIERIWFIFFYICNINN